MVHGLSARIQQKEGYQMNKLDEALVALRDNMEDTKKQSAFYDIFLNQTFFVPIMAAPKEEEIGADGKADVLPVIIESDGNDYLLLFDSLERLKKWDTEREDGPYVEVPGHVLALTSMPPLHWALNAATEFSKPFHPEEIAWLRAAVELCNEEAAKQQAGCCD